MKKAFVTAKYLIIILSIIIMDSCRKIDYAIKINKMMENEITIPKDLFFYPGNNSYYNSVMNNKTYMIIVWIDSKECNTCKLSSMGAYKNIFDYCVDSIQSGGIYFIFTPSKEKIDQFKEVLDNTTRDYPVFLDAFGSFKKMNPFLPDDSELHTFLVNSDNKIVLVGDPYVFPALQKLYKQRLKQ